MAKKVIRRSAIASLIIGMFFWVPLLNFVLGAAAIYLGISALKKIRGNPGIYKGKLLAVGGILLGIVPFYFSFFLLMKNMLDLRDILFAQIMLLALPLSIIAVMLVLKSKRLL